VDITAFPWNGFKIYAELFIDDFTMAKNPFTYYGNKFAVLAGARWISPLGLSRLDITGEYARIEPYVYTHRRPINVYQHYDQSLGHWLGPNSDDLTLQCQLLLTGNWRLRASAERTRRGEGDIETPHRDEVGFRKKFLSGVIETSWQWSLGTTIQLFRDGFLSFEYGYLLQENAERISGRNDYHHRVRLFFTVDY
jgi:hypothetical protein